MRIYLGRLVGGLLVLLGAGLVSVAAQSMGVDPESYLTWSSSQAQKIGKSTRENGKAGGSFDLRIISTNKAINYGLRATLMTPEVIRAAARVVQLRDRLTNVETRQLVARAEEAGDLVVMIEINPNEGSGVVPLDWRAILQPKDLVPGASGAVTGLKAPYLRKNQVLSGVVGRNYEYDVFWVVFPLVDENKKPLFAADVAEIQLLVGIYSSEGRISWKMPDSLRERMRTLSK
ncbi:MAG: hypothetical protein WBO10_13460 [Pyrinomonadaceae bacterium]